MSNKVGIDETKEMLNGLFGLTFLFAEVFHDGMQVSDFLRIFMKLQTDKRFIEAFEGIKQVPKEVKDIDLNEAFEIIQEVIPHIEKIINTMVKK